MTEKSITIPVHQVLLGDTWRGQAGPANRGPETVTGVANNRFRAGYMDITLTNAAMNATRTMTVNRNQWFAVLRDM